jgi:hypothetical protein
MQTLSLTPMKPKAIVSLYSRNHSFEEISSALFSLFDEGAILVNDNHEFYRGDDAVTE